MSDTNLECGSNVGPKQARSLLFSLGQVVATPAVIEHLSAHAISAREFLHRHQHGDWGAVPSEDAVANEFAVDHGLRIMSVYVIAGEKVWIITEADRSATTLLFPSEY